ncbi:hypothetical protein [Burkholderia multivorans]|uniref:hypothetical protein n=1 Tax=Burkholderia multivorans TaxID=87883 RepID=UPI0011B295EC|nr:hypothetical protein [Burkholderia multivorans]
MKEAVKVFVDAVRETPRLYFAPLVAALNAVGRVESEMTRTYKGTVRARTVDGATIIKQSLRAKKASANPRLTAAKKAAALKKKKR